MGFVGCFTCEGSCLSEDASGKGSVSLSSFTSFSLASWGASGERAAGVVDFGLKYAVMFCRMLGLRGGRDRC